MGVLSPTSLQSYLSGMMLCSPVAPALAHMRASSLMMPESREVEGFSPSNMQAFRCFQSHHAVRMIKEAKPLRAGDGEPLQDVSHHV